MCSSARAFVLLPSDAFRSCLVLVFMTPPFLHRSAQRLHALQDTDDTTFFSKADDVDPLDELDQLASLRWMRSRLEPAVKEEQHGHWIRGRQRRRGVQICLSIFATASPMFYDGAALITCRAPTSRPFYNTGWEWCIHVPISILFLFVCATSTQALVQPTSFLVFVIFLSRRALIHHLLVQCRTLVNTHLDTTVPPSHARWSPPRNCSGVANGHENILGCSLGAGNEGTCKSSRCPTRVPTSDTAGAVSGERAEGSPSTRQGPRVNIAGDPHPLNGCGYLAGSGTG
ncbi:hypothetical protein BDZ89DRAFT_1204025 [Hymenopellis radicata]|nr:hypothetical protein BDZ89DRAFT_1204025 [Hymenopellis radicata]